MTTKRPSHPLLRSLPLFAAAAAVVAAACDVAGKGGDGAAPALATAPAAASPPAGQAVRTAVGEPVIATDIPLDLSRSTLPPPTAWVGWRPRLPHGMEDYPVVELKPGGGAWRAGLRNGDVVLAMNGMDARGVEAIKSLVSQQPGTRYTIRFRRDGVVRELTAELQPLR